METLLLKFLWILSSSYTPGNKIANRSIQTLIHVDGSSFSQIPLLIKCTCVQQAFIHSKKISLRAKQISLRATMLVEVLLKVRQSSAIIAQRQVSLFIAGRATAVPLEAILLFNLIVAPSRVHDSSERATQCGEEWRSNEK